MKIICDYGEKEELMAVIQAGCAWIGTKKNSCIPFKRASELLTEKNIEWEMVDD